MRFSCFICSGLFFFLMNTSAMGTAPRLSPHFFDGHENQIVIYIYQPPSTSTDSMIPLLKQIVKEALKSVDKKIVFEIYPSKTLIRHLLDKQNGLAVVGQAEDFPDSTPARHIVLPCYTEDDVRVSVIINSKNPASDAVKRPIRTDTSAWAIPACILTSSVDISADGFS